MNNISVIPPLDSWQPLAVQDIQRELGAFKDWVLCGGYSIDLFVGHPTRAHGDIDIGIFRSQAVSCLEKIRNNRTFLCVPSQLPQLWSGVDISPYRLQHLDYRCGSGALDSPNHDF